MAGIGFRLRKLMDSDDIASQLHGVLASIVLSSGPWLISIITIAILSIFLSHSVDVGRAELFRVIVNDTYAASLIFFGFIELVATRAVSDAIYLKKFDVIYKMFVQSATFISTITFCIGLGFYSFAELELDVVVLSALLLSCVSTIWCCMVFLSACKDYESIVAAFFSGLLVSVAAAFGASQFLNSGMSGILAGFLSGQFMIAAMLTIRIRHEFKGEAESMQTLPHEWRLYSLFQKHKLGAIVGVVYALACWIDKIIFWCTPGVSESVRPWFRKSSLYDAGIFIGYLFVVPALSYFLVQVETKFYREYRMYFSLIDQKAPFHFLEQARVNLKKILHEEMMGLASFQMLFVVFALLCAPFVVEIVGLTPVSLVVFRYGVVGATFHVFLLFTNVLILYFDQPYRVLKNYFLFLLLNALGAIVTARSDLRFHGLGYSIAAFLSFLFSLASLESLLKNLHFEIFRAQQD